MLARQLRSPLLVLLAVTALASAFVGQASDAVIIGTILLASVGLGFVNEYKAEKTAEALHSSVRHPPPPAAVTTCYRAKDLRHRDFGP